MRSDPEPPLSASASGPLTRSSTDVRSKRLSHLFRLALQNLRQQVAGNGALAARELRHEPLRVGMRRKRDRRQP